MFRSRLLLKTVPRVALAALTVTACHAPPAENHVEPSLVSERVESSLAPVWQSEVLAVRLLEDWDRRRASAYVASSPAALRRLYERGSTVGRRDVGLLRAYRARGLEVVGIQMQITRVHSAELRLNRVQIEITDRLVGAAVREVETTRRGRSGLRALPAGPRTRRTITLTRATTSDEWVVSGVRQRSVP